MRTGQKEGGDALYPPQLGGDLNAKSTLTSLFACTKRTLPPTKKKKKRPQSHPLVQHLNRLAAANRHRQLATMADNDIKYYIPAACLPATIIAIKTSQQKTQSEGDGLIEYEYTEQVKDFVEEGETSTHARRAEIRAVKDGIVGTIHIKKGDVVDDERYACFCWTESVCLGCVHLFA